MKNLVSALVITFCLISCKSDDNKPAISNNGKDITAITNTMQSGTWRITQYIDSGDKTTNFSGYNFTFNNDGLVTAIKGNVKQSGAWSLNYSDNTDDDNDDYNDMDFNIAFSAPADFEEISDNWDIVESTSVKLKLVDISGGNGHTEYLTFEKN